MNIFFKEIRVVNPAQNLDEQLNLWIKEGVVIHCDKSVPNLDANTEQVDGKGLVATPGLFDMHVHLREPGEEYKEDINTGTNAAANGGFTGVVCMPNTTPTIDNVTVVEYIKNKSQNKLVDVHISAAITQNREGNQLAEMLELNDAGVVFFTDDGNSIKCSETLKRAFDYALTKDLLIAQHCEDHCLTEGFSVNESPLSNKLGLKGYPAIAETNTIFRDIETAYYVGNCRYHAMHISTRGAVELIRAAKAKGNRVTSEVTPHHFTMNDEIITSYSPNIKMNPPLRDKKDLSAILEGLADGTIDCIASDHAPHAFHEKDVEFESAPNGIIGLETALGLALTNLIHTKVLTLNQLVEKMSINPRAICGLPPIEIKNSQNANITIFALDEEWVVNKNIFKSKSKNTPFDQFKLKGKPKYAINNNKLHKSVL